MNKAELKPGDRVSVKGWDNGYEGEISRVYKGTYDGTYFGSICWRYSIDWGWPYTNILMPDFNEDELILATTKANLPQTAQN